MYSMACNIVWNVLVMTRRTDLAGVVLHHDGKTLLVALAAEHGVAALRVACTVHSRGWIVVLQKVPSEGS